MTQRSKWWTFSGSFSVLKGHFQVNGYFTNDNLRGTFIFQAHCIFSGSWRWVEEWKPAHAMQACSRKMTSTIVLFFWYIAYFLVVGDWQNNQNINWPCKQAQMGWSTNAKFFAFFSTLSIMLEIVDIYRYSPSCLYFDLMHPRQPTST